MKASPTSALAVTCTLLVVLPFTQPTHGQEVTTEPPAAQSAQPPEPEEPCPKGKRGGAIGGIVVGSVYWGLLPMSIPVLVTQSRKLKAHNKAMSERRCQYATEEPALQLQLDEAGVGVVPPPSRTPDGYTLEEMEGRVKRAKIGLGVSAALFVAGGTMASVAWLGDPCVSFYVVEECESPNWVNRVSWTGTVLGLGGLAGIITSGILLARRNPKLRELKLQSRYHEAVDVDTSDDAFLVIVTKKYKGGQLVGATVFIKHKDSGQYANPYVDAVEIDTLDPVIREHKEKLRSNVGAFEVKP